MVTTNTGVTLTPANVAQWVDQIPVGDRYKALSQAVMEAIQASTDAGQALALVQAAVQTFQIQTGAIPAQIQTIQDLLTQTVQSAHDADVSATDANQAANLAVTVLDDLHNLNVVATAGNSADASWDSASNTMSFTLPKGDDGAQGPAGNSPTIDPVTGDWVVNNINTGIQALANDGITPNIDPTSKNWFIGAQDTGILAEGKDGTVVTLLPNGNWAIDGVDTTIHAQGAQGIQGLPGSDGADGETPSIDATTKHWFLGSQDLGVKAEGDKVTIGATSQNWEINGNDTGISAVVAAAGAVNLIGNQDVDGVKTFSSSPIVPDATADNEAAALGQVTGVTGDLADLVTTDKSNLVAAINEAASSAGGSSLLAGQEEADNNTQITTQPVDITTTVGGTYAQKVEADNIIQYEWEYVTGASTNWQPLISTNGNTINVPEFTQFGQTAFPAGTGKMRCKLFGRYETTYTREATVTVQ